MFQELVIFVKSKKICIQYGVSWTKVCLSKDSNTVQRMNIDIIERCILGR